MEYSITILAFIFIIGLVIGSFLNVVILRTVSEESIVFPGSKCPKCQNPLKWYHNIPLFSYIFLRGKCAFCKEKISIQYPIVEFLTGCIFVGLFLKFCSPFDPFFGLNAINEINLIQFINYIFALIASCMFIVIAGTDILEMCVADIHTYVLSGTGMLYGVILTILNANDKIIDLDFFLTSPILYSIVLGIIGFAIMEIYRYSASKLVGQEAHGDGDAYIASGIGAYIGALMGNSNIISNVLIAAQYMLLIIALSVIIAALIGLPKFLKNILKDKFALISLIALISYSLALRYLIEWIDDNIWMTLISLIIFFLLCVFFVKEILRGIKNHQSDGIPCPFGPALVIAGFIAMLSLPL